MSGKPNITRVSETLTYFGGDTWGSACGGFQCEIANWREIQAEKAKTNASRWVISTQAYDVITMWYLPTPVAPQKQKAPPPEGSGVEG